MCKNDYQNLPLLCAIPYMPCRVFPRLTVRHSVSVNLLIDISEYHPDKKELLSINTYEIFYIDMWYSANILMILK